MAVVRYWRPALYNRNDQVIFGGKRYFLNANQLNSRNIQTEIDRGFWALTEFTLNDVPVSPDTTGSLDPPDYEIEGIPDGTSNTVLIRDATNTPIFTAQNTGFNLNVGTTAGTVAAGDHTHELDDLLATGITAGDALVADGAGGASWTTLTLSIPPSFNVYLNSTFT